MHKHLTAIVKGGKLFEYLGFIAFILIISYSSYPTKVKKNWIKDKKLEKILKGEKSMSKILSDLIDKKCVLVSEVCLDIVCELRRS